MNFENICEHIKKLLEITSYGQTTKLYNLLAEKHNEPKIRKTGVASKKCERCQRFGAHIKSYGLNLCRHCFREIAEEIGFNKYS